MPADIDPNRLAFLKGVLAALASSGQVVHYDEIRRLCRLNQELLGAYLGMAREHLVAEGQPDYCAIVVRSEGTPGEGWGGLDAWAKSLRDTHKFWRDRRFLDNQEFEDEHGSLPIEPGLG